MTDNPLAEANVRSLDELFSLNPRLMTPREREMMVTELRRQRSQWEAAEQSGAKRGQSTAPKGSVVLDDLDLGDMLKGLGGK